MGDVLRVHTGDISCIQAIKTLSSRLQLFGDNAMEKRVDVDVDSTRQLLKKPSWSLCRF